MNTLSTERAVPLGDSFVATHRWEGHMSNGIGATYGTTPMASLSANSSELMLSSPLGTCRLPRASITKVGRGKLYPWFFAGIRIHHRESKLPDELQFKPLGVTRREILDQLRILGFPVA
jgi:hypothetical protein